MDSNVYKRVVSANGSHFVSVHDEKKNRGREEPLMLNAWSQTTSDDFEVLRSVNIDSNMDAENRVLLEKVRYLENKLKEHTDLLSQIHATSARMQQSLGVADAASPTPPVYPSHQILTPPSSVICAPVQGSQQQRTEVLDYKIISASDDADAIEIRLAAESLNSLSSSSDSDRLEMCIGTDSQNQTQPSPQILNRDIKRELSRQQETAPLQFIKRRKLQEIQVQETPSPKTKPKLPLKLKPRTSDPSNGQSNDNVMISLGPNNTCVPASVFENINWTACSLATRKLLVTIFDRETLATHSMTGKPSPAFRDQPKPLKQMLDPAKIQDIIFAVTHKCNASEKEVRNAITTKCADENKMLKIQNGKRRTSGVNGKENMV
ncbi:protein insensitive [Drosophila persimilis]|uniref:protein insensitive n=1 Tax=Drosophila persimilis TaxID=7234 RepID=UPI00017FC03E|nr:protein insensitive [Drosophila persimilis]